MSFDDTGIHQLPQEIRTLLCRYEGLPPRTPKELLAAVNERVEHIEARIEQHPFADLDLAHKIADTLRSIIADWGESEDDEIRMLVTGAVSYFVEDDLAGDVGSAWGLDDDAAVVYRVRQELTRLGALGAFR